MGLKMSKPATHKFQMFSFLVIKASIPSIPPIVDPSIVGNLEIDYLRPGEAQI